MSEEIYLGGIGQVDEIGGKSTLNLQVKRSIRSQAVTIQSSATAIPTTPLQFRRGVLIINVSTNPVYIGASDVTTAAGWPIYPRGAMKIDIAEEVTIFGISSSGGDEIRILEGA